MGMVLKTVFDFEFSTHDLHIDLQISHQVMQENTVAMKDLCTLCSSAQE